MSPQRLHVRRMSPDDHPVFASLFQAVTGQVFRERCFRRKYGMDDHVRFLGHIAFERDDHAVAALGLMPQWLERDGVRILAAQAVDAVTRPEFRRQGLFRRLVRANEELARQEGVQMLFGFAHHERGSAVGLRGMGWTPAADLMIHHWPVRVSTVRRALRRLAPEQAKAAAAGVLAQASVDVDDLAGVDLARSLFTMQDAWRPVRDPAFLRGRLDMGSLLVRVDGGHAWVVIHGREMRIGDLFGADLLRVLRGTIALAAQAGMDSVALLGVVGDPLKPLLSEQPAAVRPTGGELLVQPLSTATPSVTDRFLFTSGDSDTF